MIHGREFPDILALLDRLKFSTKTQATFRKYADSDAAAMVRICLESRPPHRLTPDKEQVIINSNNIPLIKKYMLGVNIGEFPAAEPVLGTEAHSALWYALRIDKPFPAGEAIIAQNARAAYLYAVDILKRRFPAGEAAIKTNPNLWREYEEDINAL